MAGQVTLDIFKQDAFHIQELVLAINKEPPLKKRITELGWFGAESLTQPMCMIELGEDGISLVPTKPRGAPGTPVGLGKRKTKPFTTTHLPQTFQVFADEVAGLRAFGKTTETEQAMERLMKKARKAKRQLDITLEFQRIGALKGQVLDSDGLTVLLDLHTEFGVAKSTLDMELDTDASKQQQKHVALKRLVEDKLMGMPFDGITIMASEEFMDAYIGHKAIRDAWNFHNTSNRQRDDYRTGFEFMPGIAIEEYRQQVGAIRFIPAGKAYAVPTGVAELMKTFSAPADYMETVNTDGLPFYMKLKGGDFDKYVEGEVQANPLHIVSRPDAIVELSIT